MRKGLWFTMTACCALATATLSCAQETTTPTASEGKNSVAAGKDQKNPEKLLRQMADYIAGLQAFSCHVDSTINIEASAMNNRMETKMIVRLQRPNQIAFVVEQGMMGMTLVSDGEKLYQFVPMLNRYTVEDAPKDFAGLSEASGMGTAMLGATGGVIPTSGEEFYKSLMSGVTKSEYLGTEKIGDVECHHCRFSQEQLSWEIWIESGDQPLVQKVVPDLSKQFADAGEMWKDAKIEYTVVFSDWNVAPKFTETDFTFDPPADAEEVESLYEGLGGQEQGPHPLLGEKAPAFDSVDLEGQKIDLSKDIGKNIIMLDFWATWCGPCVQAMPQVEEVAKKFADRGLVFYAVNAGEDVETIKEFLKSSEIDVPVAMDPDGEISGKYGVEGIPQTVLIGKDGKVQVVHVGFSPKLGEELTKNVKDLLAGKDLAGEALNEAEDSDAEQDEQEAASLEVEE